MLRDNIKFCICCSCCFWFVGAFSNLQRVCLEKGHNTGEYLYFGA
jgi:hypothetical protein